MKKRDRELTEQEREIQTGTSAQSGEAQPGGREGRSQSREGQSQSREGQLLERREMRRRRRMRNQVISYVVVVALIAVLAVGIVTGVGELTKNARENTESTAPQEVLEELLGSEETLEEPSSTEMVVELTPEQKLDEIVNKAIEVMPLEDKVAGLFVVTPEAITGVNAAVQAGEGTQQALAEHRVGGLVYFSKNMQSEEQLKQMIDNTVLYSSYPLFIAVDEEGGSVSRVADAGIADGVDSAQEIAASGNTDNAYQAGVTVGTYLSGLGFNLDFAPVADIANVEGSSMKDRTYGADAAAAAPYVTSMLEGQPV